VTSTNYLLVDPEGRHVPIRFPGSGLCNTAARPVLAPSPWIIPVMSSGQPDVDDNGLPPLNDANWNRWSSIRDALHPRKTLPGRGYGDGRRAAAFVAVVIPLVLPARGGKTGAYALRRRQRVCDTCEKRLAKTGFNGLTP